MGEEGSPQDKYVTSDSHRQADLHWQIPCCDNIRKDLKLGVHGVGQGQCLRNIQNSNGELDKRAPCPPPLMPK